MIRIRIPRNRFQTADYPNLDPEAVGKVIPIGFGTLAGLRAVEVDTATHRYRILGQALQEITRLATPAKDPLVKDVDYQEYLSDGGFRLTYNSRFTAGHTYYFAIFGNWAIDGAHFLKFGQNTGDYAEGAAYRIDESKVWTAQSTDLRFKLWGRSDPETSELALAENLVDDSTVGLSLRETAACTRIGQSFKPAYNFYPTRLTLYGIEAGDILPSGTSKLWVVFYQAVSPEDIFAAISAEVTVADIDAGTLDLLFTGWDTSPELTCDIKAPGTLTTNVADILEGLVVDHMGKSSSVLDATALAALKAARTETLKLYLDAQVPFGEVLARLEAGQNWRLVPKMDGTYEPTIFASGEPGGTPHFHDEDFIDGLEVELSISHLYQRFTVSYAEDFETDDYLAAQAESDVARLFYFNEESLAVDTFLTAAADAVALTTSRRTMFEGPRRIVRFKVHGWGLDLVPGRDKVKITTARGPGGPISGELYRILSLVKQPGSGTVEIRAVLDTQTY